MAQTESGAPSFGGMLLQVLGALLLITTLIVGAGIIAKRLNLVHPSTNAHLKTLASLSLGRKEKVVVVDACGKRLLLGVGSGNVNFLYDLSTEKNEEQSECNLGSASGSQNFSTSDLDSNLPPIQNFSNNSFEESVRNPNQNEALTAKPEFSRFLKKIMAKSRRENNA